LASQLPDDREEALRVVAYLREVIEFVHGAVGADR
jgi:hypothetical protein